MPEGADSRLDALLASATGAEANVANFQDMLKEAAASGRVALADALFDDVRDTASFNALAAAAESACDS